MRRWSLASPGDCVLHRCILLRPASCSSSRVTAPPSRWVASATLLWVAPSASCRGTGLHWAVRPLAGPKTLGGGERPSDLARPRRVRCEFSRALSIRSSPWADLALKRLCAGVRDGNCVEQRSVTEARSGTELFARESLRQPEGGTTSCLSPNIGTILRGSRAWAIRTRAPHFAICTREEQVDDPGGSCRSSCRGLLSNA